MVLALRLDPVNLGHIQAFARFLTSEVPLFRGQTFLLRALVMLLRRHRIVIFKGQEVLDLPGKIIVLSKSLLQATLVDSTPDVLAIF